MAIERANNPEGTTLWAFGIPWRRGSFLPVGTANVEVVWWYETTESERAAGAPDRESVATVFDIGATREEMQDELDRLREEKYLSQRWRDSK